MCGGRWKQAVKKQHVVAANQTKQCLIAHANASFEKKKKETDVQRVMDSL